jgi:hypothetical protein
LEFITIVLVVVPLVMVYVWPLSPSSCEVTIVAVAAIKGVVRETSTTIT